MLQKSCRALLAVLAVAFLAAVARPGLATPPAPAQLTADQIVQQMQRSNQSRTERLTHYNAVRHYQVEYRGFSAVIAAKMDVAVSFDAPAKKSFQILSESGSKLLRDKVLKRLLETEQDALKDQSATALSPSNYTFRLEGSESLAGHPAYVLRVEPITASKLLYRGRIWVDATDFAVAKIDAEPAKNPSFWIASTQIRHTYGKTGDFWLPQLNRSETKVRIGGTAVLTIDYGTYTLGTEGSRPPAVADAPLSAAVRARASGSR